MSRYPNGKKEILYIVNVGTNVPVETDAEKQVYGERMSATFEEAKMFLLTLRILDYNDTNTFEFDLTVKRGSTEFKAKNETIELLVQGMLSMNSCSCFGKGKGKC